MIETLESALSPALKDCVAVWEVPPYTPIAGLPDIRQVFVCTDAFMVGSVGPDQVIELQVDRDRMNQRNCSAGETEPTALGPWTRDPSGVRRGTT